MDLGLTGKVCLVTGSTAGIGFATARQLAREGASVIVNGRTQARVDAAIAALRGEVAEVTGVAADLATAAGAAAVIAAAPRVDVLINNAAMFGAVAFGDISDAAWSTIFETNVMSGVRLARHYLPAMVAAGWGRVVFVSSESAVQIPVEMIHYGVTKTAQLALSRGLAESVRGTGVTVNAVLPGPTKSEGVGTFVGQLARQRGLTDAEMEAEFFKSVRPSSLIGRFSTIDEIANMITYTASAAASATTGAALRVDGGVVRSIL